MKWFFFTFNRKILYLAIVVVCRKKLTERDRTDCKIVIVEEEEEAFRMDIKLIMDNLLNFR
jgi:hypothetical protein